MDEYFLFYCSFTVWIDDILFIYLPVDGHLDCFHFLAITNNVALKIRVQVFVYSLLLDKFLGVELLGHMVSLCLNL